MNERNKILMPAFVRLRSLTIPTPNRGLSDYGLHIHPNPRYARTSDTRQPLAEIPHAAGIFKRVSYMNKIEDA